MNFVEQLLLKKVIQATLDHLGLDKKLTPDEVLKFAADLKADHKLAISSAEIMAVLQGLCEVSALFSKDICPFINS